MDNFLINDDVFIKLKNSEIEKSPGIDNMHSRELKECK